MASFWSLVRASAACRQRSICILGLAVEKVMGIESILWRAKESVERGAARKDWASIQGAGRGTPRATNDWISTSCKRFCAVQIMIAADVVVSGLNTL